MKIINHPLLAGISTINKELFSLITATYQKKLLKNAPKGWKVNSEKKVYSSDLIELYEDSLNLSGTGKVYIRGIRKDYSTVVPFVSNKEILVIKSYRHLVDSVQIEVPSGYIDKGESPEEAAIRELRRKRVILHKM